jgi:hypothetical protein
MSPPNGAMNASAALSGLFAFASMDAIVEGSNNAPLTVVWRWRCVSTTIPRQRP